MKSKRAPTTPKLTPRQRLARLRRNERAALLELVARLREKFSDRIQNVILYGSRARGEGKDESDLDVLVIVPSKDPDLRQWLLHETTGLILQYGALLSPQIWTADYFDLYRRNRLLFYRNIKRDGIDLWTKPSAKNKTLSAAI